MRKIRPRSRAVKKSEESQRVLDALDAYLEGNIDEPVRWLVRFWQDQAAVMLYRELRELVIGETDPESLFDIWFQDYSKMLSEKMTPVWEQAFLEGWKNNSLFCGAEDVISSESWVRSWIVDHTGDLITNCCNEQVSAIRYLIAEAESLNMSSAEMLLVIEFVKSTLCLKIKDSWSLFRTGYVDRNGKQKGRDLDYMGLVFHGQNLIKRCYSGKTVTIRNVSTRIRASIFLKARRKIHRFAKKIKNKKIIGSKFAMSTIAYNGWFVTTDSFLVRVAECWDQLISMAKNIISRYAKQKSYAMEKYYKKWRKLNYA